MSLLQKFLGFWIMATCAAGLPGAGSADAVQDANNAGAPHHVSRSPAVVPDSYSFADIVNLSATAGPRLPADGILGRAPGQTLPQLSRIGHPVPALPGAISNLNNAFDELSSFSYGDPTAGPGSALELFPTDEIPEPSGWMLLLSGLAIAGFMARRKRGPSAD